MSSALQQPDGLFQISSFDRDHEAGLLLDRVENGVDVVDENGGCHAVADAPLLHLTRVDLAAVVDDANLALRVQHRGTLEA